MNGQTSKERLTRLAELDEPDVSDLRVTEWLDRTFANTAWIEREMTVSASPGHGARKVIDEIIDGKPTGRVALARVEA